MDKTLTVDQAFRAMFYFLEEEFSRTHADEIGGLLSSLSWEITGGYGPADPGAWDDWLSAVEKAKASDASVVPPQD